MNDRIKGFDGLRGLGAVSVVLMHLNLFEYVRAHGIIPGRLIPMVDGGAAVQYFFILSGFLITLMFRREYHGRGRISIKKFFGRRAVRILPVYVLFLLCVTVMHMLGNAGTSWKSLLVAYGYGYNFIPKAWYSLVLGHSWALGVEQHFYLIWPFVFAFLYTGGRKRLGAGLAACIVLSMVLRVILSGNPWLAGRFFIGRWSFIAGADIAMGCLAALAVSATGKQANPAKYDIGLLAAAVCLFSASLYMPEKAVAIEHSLRTAGITGGIVWLYRHQETPVVRVLDNPVLRYLGTVSYSIYVWQGFFLGTGPFRLPGQTWPPAPTTGLIMLTAAVPLSYHFIEKPFIRFKRTFS